MKKTKRKESNLTTNVLLKSITHLTDYSAFDRYLLINLSVHSHSVSYTFF